MNRVFRGALFPILIVIVLAFFVSKLISPSASAGQPHNYQTFVNQDIPAGKVKSFTADPANNAINVTLTDGTRYSVGYDPGTSMLQNVITEVDGVNKQLKQAGQQAIQFNIVPKG